MQQEPTTKIKIALIEDVESFAFVVEQLFPKYEFIHFPEVSVFVDAGFDVVLADLRLKETYGDETISKLRPLTSAPIVALTGMGGLYLSAQDMQQILDAGACDVFNKESVTDPTFPVMIEKIINNHKAVPNETSPRV